MVQHDEVEMIYSVLTIKQFVKVVNMGVNKASSREPRFGLSCLTVCDCQVNHYFKISVDTVGKRILSS